MPIALKAQWVVTAGIVPGQKLDEYTKIWQMTSEEAEAENKNLQVSSLACNFRIKLT